MFTVFYKNIAIETEIHLCVRIPALGYDPSYFKAWRITEPHRNRVYLPKSWQEIPIQ